MAKKLFVGNIEWGVTDEDLQKLFADHGEVEEAVIIKDKFSGRPKGFGFVTFVNDEDADKAIEALNDYELNGRKLAVNEAKPKEPRD
jgi:RNA recognition motif-containing protein